jgi:hypothetical protein
MGRFFSLAVFRFLGSRFDTIARKPGHDKATCRMRRHAGLELRRPDRHCLGDLTMRSRSERVRHDPD